MEHCNIAHIFIGTFAVKVLKETTVDSVRNRLCRTLGNLALDVGCAEAIHEEEEVLASIVGMLKATEDVECQQTYLRTLR